MPEYQNLRLEVSEGVVLLTIDRARGMNVLNLETLGELGEVFGQLQDDREVRVVVIQGAGDRAFSAGADIKELDRLDAASGAAFSSEARRSSIKSRTDPRLSSRRFEVTVWEVAASWLWLATCEWHPRMLGSGCPRSNLA